jgi:prephenate dehydrogenase
VIESMEAVAKGTHYAPSHPMFGPMSPEDWMRWGYLHADHHLRQFGR